MNILVKSAVGTAVLGAGVVIGSYWNGNDGLLQVEEQTKEVVEQANAVIDEMEKVIKNKQIEINDIKGMYYDMEERVQELQAANDILRESIDRLEGSNSPKGQQNRLLEAEVQKANADAEAHVQRMNEILEGAEFMEVAE